MLVKLLRTYLDTETIGSLWIDGVRRAYTLELPWNENKRSVSCIPEGIYKVVREATSSGHDYPHFRVLNVPKRSGILWHKITYVKDLRGCIGIVGEFYDLNKDSVPDAIKSGITLQSLYDILPDSFDLEIIKK